MFSKVSKWSKWCLINIFYGSSEDFGKYTFHVFSTLWNYLVNSLFCNIINVITSSFDYTWSNFICLVNKEHRWSLYKHRRSHSNSKSLLSAFFVLEIQPLFAFLFVFFFVGTCWNLKFSGSTTRKPKAGPFLISIWSSKDLFNISTHRQCFPWNVH